MPSLISLKHLCSSWTVARLSADADWHAAMPYRALSTVLSAMMLSLASIGALGAPSNLDASFGSGGRVLTAMGTSHDNATTSALQSDGKILVAGWCQMASVDFCIVRYLSDGTLDGTFGSNGKIFTDMAGSIDFVNAMTLQPDGKIVVVGGCLNGAFFQFCLARYLTDGTLDTTFGTGGRVFTSLGDSHAGAYAVAVQPDGRIVLGGHCVGGVADDFCLARYHANGGLDDGFGVLGRVITVMTANRADRITALILRPDGKLIAGGVCNTGEGNPYRRDACLARYLPTGQLDSEFGVNGKVERVEVAYINSVALLQRQDLGLWIAGGGASSNIVYSGLATVNANAALSSGWTYSFWSSNYYDSPQSYSQSLAYAPDGKLIIGGACIPTLSSTSFCITRLHTDNRQDPSFESAGPVPYIRTAVGGVHDYATGLLVQRDGKIIQTGLCERNGSNDFCMVRYEGGPLNHRGCDLDIDGDGKVLATTDTLILTRVALGMSGASILSGVSISPSSPRRDWPAIRDYLSLQCGMAVLP